MSVLLSTEEVSVIDGAKTVLKDISLEIKAQDFITIVGPNGAGKTMLLKCLMGFYRPTRGRVWRKPNLKVGYMPQRFSPDPIMPLTAERFLCLRKKHTTKDLERVIEETNISHCCNEQLTTLSGGELQRVLLARSLLGHPDVLILDEPAQNLDVASQIEFYKLLKRVYTERGSAVLMVSHDLHMVMSSSKEVVCLFQHICCRGEPQTVAKTPEFVSLFGSDMAALMSVYQHSHDHNHEHKTQEERQHD